MEPRDARDALLGTGGRLLIGAGLLAGLTGAVAGLERGSPNVVVLSILLLMGYGVVGYLLLNHGPRLVRVLFPAAAVLVLLTLILFQAEIQGLLLDEFAALLLLPGLTYLLAQAGGALIAWLVQETSPKVAWPPRGAGWVATPLHIAAVAPVWAAFALLQAFVLTPVLTVVVVGGATVAAVAGSVGGHVATMGRHPRISTACASLLFAASVLFLYQFMLGGSRSDFQTFGQLLALTGLILSGLPLAIAVVAWVHVDQPTAPPSAP